MKVTFRQVEDWLGQDALDEAIHILVDIANGEYGSDVLKMDIEQY